MKKVKVVIVFLVVALVSSGTADAQKRRSTKAKTGGASKVASQTKDMLTMLQGRWSSLDDKKTFFQVEGNNQINIYGRDILDTSVINFYDDCPNRISPDDEQRVIGKYLTTQRRPDDFYCYSIDKISSQQLVLTYLPKGSILRYKKVPTIKLQAAPAIEERED